MAETNEDDLAARQKVTVKDGDVKVVDEMTMRPRPIDRPQGEKP